MKGTATTELYTPSLHDALPIYACARSESGSRRSQPSQVPGGAARGAARSHQVHRRSSGTRSEEHTSELQSLRHLVCRLLLEKKKTTSSLLWLGTPTEPTGPPTG